MGAEKDWYQPNTGKMHQAFFEVPGTVEEQERQLKQDYESLMKTIGQQGDKEDGE